MFAFGGLVLAGIPVLLAMSAVVAAGGLTAISSHLLPVTDVTQSVILLIGLAVGVDYSIFYLARERRERAPATARWTRSRSPRRRPVAPCWSPA